MNWVECVPPALIVIDRLSPIAVVTRLVRA